MLNYKYISVTNICPSLTKNVKYFRVADTD